MDQQIIDCLVDGDRDRLDRLSARNGGETALRARATALGLTKEVIKKCRLGGTPPALRSCLRCDDGFVSWGLPNRICHRCSKK